MRNVKLFSILILVAITASYFSSAFSVAFLYKIQNTNGLSSHLTRINIPSTIIKGAIKFSEGIYYIPGEKPSKKYINEDIFLVLFISDYSIRKLKQKNNEKCTILHIYSTLPLILIKASLQGLIGFLKENKMHDAYIFPNKYYYPAVINRLNEDIAYSTLTNVLDIGAKYFWTNGYAGTNIKIGIIDTGIDSSHPDLHNKIIAAKSFVLKKYGYDVNETSTEDGNGHGTFIASVICGTGIGSKENGTGVAPNAIILNARVFPSGKVTLATTAGLIAALEWLSLGSDGRENTGDEADIINMSISGPPSFTDPLRLVIDNIVKNGIIVVTAAGNNGDSGTNSMSITTPGNSLHSITVGGAQINGSKIFDFSSIGPTPDLTVKPDITAPAKAVAASPGGGYQEIYGTSVSTAYVAGSVALILQYIIKNNIVSSKEDLPGFIKTILLLSAKMVQDADELWCGAGYINLKQAYLLLQSVKNGTNTKLLYVAPNHIPVGHTSSQPFFPYGKYVFKGRIINLNLTISSTFTGLLKIELSENLKPVATLLSSSEIFLNSTIAQVVFSLKIRENAPEGLNYGSIRLSNDLNILMEIPIEFYVSEEKGKLILDLRHSPLIENMKFGLYREFLLLAESRGYFIEHNWEPLSLPKLLDCDILFIPNAFPAITVYNINGSIKEVFYPSLTEEEIDAIRFFVENIGLAILSISFPITNSFSRVNKITENFFMKPREVPLGSAENPIIINANSSILLNNNVSNLLHYGSIIEVKSPFINVIASLYNLPTAGLYLGCKGGLLLFSSTRYLDNYGFASKYRNDIRTLALNILNFVLTDNSYLNSTKQNVIRGEEVKISIKIGDTYDFGVIYASDLLGTTILTNVSTRNTTITFSINTRVANPLYIGLKLVKASKFIVRQHTVVVKPKNKIKPVVICYQNLTLINLTNKEYLNVTCILFDDEGLLPPEYFIIETRLSEFSAKYKIVNLTTCLLSIAVNTELLQKMAQYYKLNKLKIEFKISVVDIDLNNATNTLIIYAYLPIETNFHKILPDLIVSILIILMLSALIIHEKSKEWKKNEIKYAYILLL